MEVSLSVCHGPNTLAQGSCPEGHYERKLKHLNNQKESKKLMKKVGTVELPQEAFFSLLKTKS